MSMGTTSRKPASSKSAKRPGRERLEGAAVGAAVGSLLTTGLALASAAATAPAPPVIHGCVSKPPGCSPFPDLADGARVAPLFSARTPPGRPGRPDRPGRPAGASSSLARYKFSAPGGLAFDGHHLWVANGGNGSVTEINARNGAFVRNLSGGS